MTIETKINYALLTKVLNIFNNIKYLYLTYAEYNSDELNKKIDLPKLEFISFKKFSYFNIFSRLNSLKRIWIEELDHIDNIDSIIDPNKILFLRIENVLKFP